MTPGDTHDLLPPSVAVLHGPIDFIKRHVRLLSNLINPSRSRASPASSSLPHAQHDVLLQTPIPHDVPEDCQLSPPYPVRQGCHCSDLLGDGCVGDGLKTRVIYSLDTFNLALQ